MTQRRPGRRPRYPIAAAAIVFYITKGFRTQHPQKWGPGIPHPLRISGPSATASVFHRILDQMN
jgi:hypothetical protein